MTSLKRLPPLLIAVLIVVGGVGLWRSLRPTPATSGDDLRAEKAQAAATGRDLLLYFGGSDWCAPCIALRDEVFSQPRFEQEALDELLFVDIDFPRTRTLPGPLRQRNDRLAEAYDVSHFPTVVLADAAGRPYALTSYRPGGVEPYLQHLEAMRQRRVRRDEAFAAAAEAQDVEKARLLDRGLSAIEPAVVLPHYRQVVDEILSLTADRDPALAEKYRGVLDEQTIGQEVDEAVGKLYAGRFDEGLADLDRLIRERSPEGQALQNVLSIKAQVALQRGQSQHARAMLKQAIAAAPDSPIVANLERLLDSVAEGEPSADRGG